MATEKKQKQVEKFTEFISGAEAAISVNYSGLSVAQQQQLRCLFYLFESIFIVVQLL